MSMAHELREAAGQIALRLGGVLPPKEIGDDETEHPVAKKFEPFVIAWPSGAARAGRAEDSEVNSSLQLAG